MDLKSALPNGFVRTPIFTPFGNVIIVDDNRHETRRGDPPVAPDRRSHPETIPKIRPGTNIIFTTINAGPICKTAISQPTQSDVSGIHLSLVFPCKQGIRGRLNPEAGLGTQPSIRDRLSCVCLFRAGDFRPRWIRIQPARR